LTSQRLAIIGCGFIGTVHSFALRALVQGGLADASVVATCDLDPSKARRMLDANGEGIATTDLDVALADVDAAWVCTPTATHSEVVSRCVANRVAMYCEKPLATDLAGAESIFREVSESGIPSQVGLVLRSSHPVASMAAICKGEPLRNGPDPEELGSPIAAILRDDQYFPIGGMYGSRWRADVETAGGGTLIEHSIHDIDLLSWMFGPVVSVVARTANHAGHKGVEDVAAVTLEHESGTTTQLMSVWHDLRTRPSTRRLEVFFERAHAVLSDESAGPVSVETADGTAEIGMPEEVKAVMERLGIPDELKVPLLAYASADLGFLQSVEAGRPPSPGLGVAVEAHRVVDAAYRSASGGGKPMIPDRP
jgi:UDP-N-acetyl-2-amino-2-deoxyglucuronate dehydrogenase